MEKGKFAYLTIRFKRFGPMPKAHSGNDPNGPFRAFIGKDPIKNLDVRRDERTYAQTQVSKDWIIFLDCL